MVEAIENKNEQKGIIYSLHRKKVYTCGKAKYSKSRGVIEKVGGVPHRPTQWWVWRTPYFPSGSPQF